jgi:hypothetical protein
MRAVSGKRPALRQKSNPYTVLSTATIPNAHDDLGEFENEFDFADSDDDAHGEPEIHHLQVSIDTKNKNWQKYSNKTETHRDPYWPVYYAVEMYKRTLRWQNEDSQTQADWTFELCNRLNTLIFPSFAQGEDDCNSSDCATPNC